MQNEWQDVASKQQTMRCQPAVGYTSSSLIFCGQVTLVKKIVAEPSQGPPIMPNALLDDHMMDPAQWQIREADRSLTH